MTDFDKKLIEKTNDFSRWDFFIVDIFIRIADTDEARELLRKIRWELYDLTKDALE